MSNEPNNARRRNASLKWQFSKKKSSSAPDISRQLGNHRRPPNGAHAHTEKDEKREKERDASANKRFREMHATIDTQYN